MGLDKIFGWVFHSAEMSVLCDPSDLWSILAPTPSPRIEESKFFASAFSENKYFYLKMLMFLLTPHSYNYLKKIREEQG